MDDCITTSGQKELIFMKKLHRKASRLITLSLAFGGLAGCQSMVAPLDPLIGDTGQPLSAVAQAADVKTYDLVLEIDPAAQSISGVGRTGFVLLQPSAQVELKLDSRFHIDKIEVGGTAAVYQRHGGVLTIALGAEQPAGTAVDVAVFYHGKPHVAKNAPWAGGTVWAKTPDGKPWIATAVQGEGCDLFWPCKDHFADKADSMRLRLTVPNGLSAVTNGVLQQVTPVGKDQQQFDWLLSVPASDYNIALNIGPFQRVQDSYTSVNGSKVAVEFWALPENADKAKTLWQQDVLQQVQWFERQLGPYPWGDQKLGFVETPHLGMEHQTVNAYGKGYKRDDYGFDWLAHHELAHEWFGNLITHKTLNHAWVHEGFGLYMQPAYAKDKLGIAAYNYQMYKSYLGLLNCDPVVRSGTVSSDDAFNPDIYGKGGWVLHTLRYLIGEQLFWQASRELLYGTAQTQAMSYPMTPAYRTTEDFIAIVNRLTGKDYQWLFDVYLYQAALPELMDSTVGDVRTLSWKVPADKPFPMPVPVVLNGQPTVLDFSKGPVQLKAQDQLQIDPEMQILRQLPLIGLCEENQQKVKNKRKG
jgi:aminopeptidase N